MKNIEILLKNNIKKFGGVSVESFFNVVLYHEKYGYYKTSNIVGKFGDFITAPEISQTFGEIISNVFLLNYNKVVHEKLFSLLELGPGRGLLSKDILRTIKTLKPDFFKKIKDLYFFEKSQYFFNYLKELHNSTIIFDDIGNIPNNFNFIVANEFFDALPVNQFIFKKGNWYEIFIILDNKENFIFTHSKNPVKINHFFPRNPPDGYIFEYSYYMINLLANICQKINTYGGIFVIIDYARNKSNKNSTLASIKRHKKVDLFHDLGNCDISYMPDFELLKKVCIDNKCEVFGPYTQSLFLQNYGINERINSLVKSNPKMKSDLQLQKLRLIGQNYMGNIFKVLIITDSKYNYELI